MDLTTKSRKGFSQSHTKEFSPIVPIVPIVVKKQTEYRIQNTEYRITIEQ
jgi:hypothetical protein